ncbi:MAG: tetratricopeptide repeat protein [Fibrobacterota bacterium]
MKLLRRLILLLPLVALAVYLLIRADVFTGSGRSGIPYLSINGTVYTSEDYNDFVKIKNLFPIQDTAFIFPDERGPESFLIETVLFWDDAREYEDQIMGTSRWELLQTYWKGYVYAKEVLIDGLGATDDEIRAYFEKNANDFITGGQDRKEVSYMDYRQEIAEVLFLEEYPPSQEFRAAYDSSSAVPLDSAWLEKQKKDLSSFFLRTFYRDKYDSDLPDRMKVLVGKNKLISESELSELMTWLPERMRRGPKDSRYPFARHILKWKIFAEKAESTGYADSKDAEKEREWFRKYVVVHHYINNVLPNKLGPYRELVEQNVAYAYWDKYGDPLSISDSVLYSEVLDSYSERMNAISVNKHIFDRRRSNSVSFISDKLNYFYFESPDSLYQVADSFATAGATERAEVLYRDLKEDYAFAQEGLDAHLKLAEQYKKKNLYKKAVKCYRDYIILSGRGEDFCNEYFMIAMLYGDKLERLKQAGANYKWIFENSPECSMADDAEFMYLHLGEPIPDIDELKAMNRRQGSPAN